MVAVGEFAIIFVLPLYLIYSLGLDTLQAGFVLAAMAIGAFFSGASARLLAARFGSPGTVLIGLGLEFIGIVAVALVLSATSSAWLIAALLVVYGLGLGLASAQLTGTVLGDVPTEVSGQASATQSTVRQVGSAMGTAFSGAALSVALSMTLPTTLKSHGLSVTASDELASRTRDSAGSTIAGLREQGASSDFGARTHDIVNALSEGFSDATRISLLVASAFILLGFIAAIKVRASANASHDPANDQPRRE